MHTGKRLRGCIWQVQKKPGFCVFWAYFDGAPQLTKKKKISPSFYIILSENKQFSHLMIELNKPNKEKEKEIATGIQLKKRCMLAVGWC